MTDDMLEKIKVILSIEVFNQIKKEKMEHHSQLIDWLTAKILQKHPDFKPDDFVIEALQIGEKDAEKQAVITKDFQVEMFNLVLKTLAPYQQTEVAA